MLQSMKAKVLVVVLALVLVVWGSVTVLSQQQGPPMPQYPGMEGGGGNQPMPGMPGPGQMGPNQMGPNQMGPGMMGGGGRMGGMGGGSAAIAATAEYVYVVQGNTLYQFSAKTLKQTNKAELSSGTKTQNPIVPNQGQAQ